MTARPFHTIQNCAAAGIPSTEEMPRRSAPSLGGEPDQRRNEVGVHLGRLPARGVDRLVIGDRLLDAGGLGIKHGFKAVARSKPAALAAPGVAQFRGALRDVIGKAHPRGFLVPGAGVEDAFDEEPGASQSGNCGAKGRRERIELVQGDGVPTRTFGRGSP